MRLHRHWFYWLIGGLVGALTSAGFGLGPAVIGVVVATFLSEWIENRENQRAVDRLFLDR